MSELQWTEIDGVTTVWTQTPGPLHAQLIFRTGMADETLVTSGQTHLLEHLVLESVGDDMHRHNGFVSPLTCGFVTTGRPEEVSDFLLGITRVLREIPADRLEAEKSVIDAENASTAPSGPGMLLTWRYGAIGHGLTGLPQLGVRNATIAQIRELAEQRFTRDNAVLWLSGPPPAGLRMELQAGRKSAPPRLVPLSRDYPGWITDDASPGVASGSIVPRTMASLVFRVIAENRLHEQLRAKRALSYSPSVRVDHLDANNSHFILFADSDESRRPELVEAFGQIFETLAQVSDDEVRVACNLLVDQWSGSRALHPDEQRCADAQNAAYNWLLDRKSNTIEELQAGCTALTSAQIANFAEQVRSTAIIALPDTVGDGAPWMGQRIAASTTPPVTGRELRPSNPLVNQGRLVAGVEGISLHAPDGYMTTVRYSSLAAVLRFEDGTLHLVGTDGLFVPLEPSAWRDGHSVLQDVLRSTPPHLLLDQGPPPRAPEEQVSGRSVRPRMDTSSVVKSVGIAILGGMGALFFLMVLIESLRDPALMSEDWIVGLLTIAMIAAPLAVCIAMLVHGTRQLLRKG